MAQYPRPADGLKFKLRANRGMAFHIVTIFSIMPVKTLQFLWPKISIQI